MAFIFNLQKLMDLRGKYEEQAKNYLNKKINERIQAEEKIEKINKTIKQFDEDFNKELHISVSPDRFKQLLEYKEHLKKQRDILVKEYQAKLKEEESAREEYLEAKKEKDILSKLKERKEEEFKYNEKLLETKTMDEVSQNLYNQKNKKMR